MDSETAIHEVLSPSLGKLRKAGVDVSVSWRGDGHCGFDRRGVGYLRLALACLLDNAWEAMGDDRPRRVAIRGWVSDDVVRVAVCDSGRGIPREILPDVFEPLCTSKTGHAGLGLTICRECLATLGGSVAIAATGSEGTKIVVELPLGCTAPESAVPAPLAPVAERQPG